MKKLLYVMFAVLLLVGAVVTFASCSEDPSYYFYEVSYNPVSKQLTWSDNSPAEQWLVTINGGKSEKVSSQWYDYDAQNQTFEVKIEGLYKDEGHSDNPVIRVTMQYLPPVENLRVENGYLIWDAVSGATGYTVTNNGSSYHVNECSYSIPTGSFNITVKPQGSNYYYTYESEKISGMILASPTTIAYDNDVFTWDAIPGADYYQVTINGDVYETTQNSYPFQRNQKDIEISVAAGSKQAGAYLSAPLTKTCYYLQPLTAESFAFNESGNLVWTAVENATSYRLTINEVNSETVLTPEYSGFQLDTRYNIKVTPQREFSYTDAPITYSFEKLSAVTGVSFNEGKITWNAHQRAAAYEVLVNGQKYTTENAYYNLAGIKENITIEVYALGSGENSRSFTASKEVYTYLPEVKSMDVVDGALTWGVSEGAIRYDICIVNMNNQTLSSETNTYKNIQPNQQYIVKIIPRGGERAYSYWSGEFTFTVLAAPTLVYDNGGFKWNGTSDAAGYKVCIVNPDGSKDYEDVPANQMVYNNTYTTAGKYEISVKAVANKSVANVYDSAYSAVKYVTRLGNITAHELINTAAVTDTVQISLKAVDGAVGYGVKINGTEQANSGSNIVHLDLNSLVNNDEETKFTFEAYAKGQVTADSVVLDSLSPYTFTLTRLATPKNLTIQGTTVKWNNVNNALQYVISIDGKTVEAGTSQHQLTNLTPGDHKVKVQAICRDSQDYIPSAWTPELSFQKLATPENVMVTTQGEALYVKWTALNGATAYSVKVGNATYDSTMNMYRISDYVNGLAAGTSLQISVFAKGNGSTVLDSEPSQTISIVKFAAPTGLAVQGDNLVWNPAAVDGIQAQNYELYINAEVVPVTGTQYSVANLTPGTYTISVMAKGNNSTTIDSPKSGAITVTKLAPVQNVTMTAGGKSVTWDAVPGAQSYVVNMNGQDYVLNQPKFDMPVTEAGTKKLIIKATSGDPLVIESEPVEQRIEVRAFETPKAVDIEQLSAGKFCAYISGEYLNVEVGAIEGMNVTYRFTVGGVTVEQSSPMYSYKMPYTDAGLEYVVQVQILVDGFGTDGIYYINSNPSAELTLMLLG